MKLATALTTKVRAMTGMEISQIGGAIKIVMNLKSALLN